MIEESLISQKNMTCFQFLSVRLPSHAFLSSLIISLVRDVVSFSYKVRITVASLFHNYPFSY